MDNEYPDHSIFNDKTVSWFEKEKIPMLFFFYDSKTSIDKKLALIKDAGAEIKGTALTVIADINRPEVLQFANKHGFYDFPALTIFDNDEIITRYYCKKRLKNLKKMHIYRCIERFREGKLNPIEISEPMSAMKENSKGVVTYQVGNNFNQLFRDFKKYHFVFFFDSKTTDSLNKFIEIANSIGKTKTATFNMFNLDKNHHEEVNHLDAGTLILLSPKASSVPQLKISEG